MLEERRAGGAVMLPEECGWLTDEELGLVPEPYWLDEDIEERCGCRVHPSDLHDVDDCLEAQADEAAYQEDLRQGGMWEVR
jgi:hypothetical protein